MVDCQGSCVLFPARARSVPGARRACTERAQVLDAAPRGLLSCLVSLTAKCRIRGTATWKRLHMAVSSTRRNQLVALGSVCVLCAGVPCPNLQTLNDTDCDMAVSLSLVPLFRFSLRFSTPHLFKGCYYYFLCCVRCITSRRPASAAAFCNVSAGVRLFPAVASDSVAFIATSNDSAGATSHLCNLPALTLNCTR